MLFLNLDFVGVIIIFFVLIYYPFSDEEYNFIFKNRDFNFWLLVLVLVVYLILLIIEVNYKLSINFLFFILYYLMTINDLVRFFLIYEIIFVLIIFRIILLGYSFERLIASYLIIFYSFLFSRPTLIILIIFERTFLIKNWLWYTYLINIFFVGSFLVKFPVFGFHYWLPVAHVEASTVGSMILAALLLKLGGIGLFYVITYINFIIKLHWLVLRVPLTIIIILILRDLKIIIAYSSVAHITIVFYVIIVGSFVRTKGSLFIIFYHGFISALIFWVVGILAWWKTRSLLVIKILSFSYLFLLVLFLLCILNIGFPPFIGFLSEILILKSLLLNKLCLIIISSSVLISCYYNIYLFWCFNRFTGLVFKINFYSFELFMFIGFSLILNF